MFLTEEKKYKVYVHIFPNNKKYVGITARDKIEYRWREGRGYEAQPLMDRAIKKYGWNNIEHIIVAENLSWQEASQKEKDLIKSYKTTDRKFGYNISIGGEKTGLGSKRTKEQTEKTVNTRRARKKYNVSEETKEKLRQANLGKKQSEEAKRKRRITILKKRNLPITEENIKNPLPKIKYPRKKTNKIKIKRNQISPMKGKHHSLETRLKLSQIKKGKPGTRTGTHLSELQKQHLREINLGKKASEETRKKISLKTKKLIWIYKNNHSKRITKEKLQSYLDEKWLLGRNPEVGKKISQMNTGKKINYVRQKLSEKTKKQISQKLKEYFVNHKVPFCKKVGKFDLNDKLIEQYESLQEASDKNNISKSGICICCRGKAKLAGGYKWRYM